MQIITSFGAEATSLTLSEAASRVDLPRATVRRSLLTLAQLGYVRIDGRMFSLTPRVLELASGYLAGSPVAGILQPCCERLASDCNATFSVAALDGEYAVMVAYAAPRRMYMEATGIGLRLPAFCTAVGRVLIAGLEPVAREQFLKQLKPKAITQRTETSKTRLRSILDQVASDGYAIAEEEAELGYRSLAVPLRRAGGRVIFALNTGMHVDRQAVDALRATYLPRLLVEARRLSAQLI